MQTIFYLNIFDGSKEQRILLRASKIEDVPREELPSVGDTVDFTGSEFGWDHPIVRVRRFRRRQSEEIRVAIEMKTDSRPLMDHLVATEGWIWLTLQI